MYNYDDILARLRNGEDAEVIAQEMVDTLNKANRDFTDEKEKADNQKQKKVDAAKAILDSMIAYVREFHPENPLNEVLAQANTENMEDLANAVDAAVEEFGILTAIAKSIGPDLEKLINVREIARPRAGAIRLAAGNTNPIDAFLKANGLA
jgi:hypothetical protein